MLFRPISLLCCCYFFLLSAAFSQEKSAGYFIDRRNDTVHGTFLNYVPSPVTPAEIPFETTDNQLLLLNPRSCLGLSISRADVFISRNISRLANLADLEFGIADIDSTEQHITEPVFLRLVFKSANWRLFEYKDDRRANYFLEDSTGNLRELIYKVSMTSRMLVKDVRFRNQLQQYFAYQLLFDKALRIKLERLEYSSGSLIQFLSKATGELPQKKERVKYPNLVLGAGLALGIGPAGGSPATTLSRIPGPVLAIGYIVPTGKVMGRSFFMPELKLYCSYATMEVADFGQLSEKGTALQRADLSLYLGAYVYRSGRMRWYAAVGPQLVLARSEDYFNSTAVLTNQVFPAVHLKTGAMIDRRLGLWMATDVLPLTVVPAFFREHHTRRSVQAGMEWRLSI